MPTFADVRLQLPLTGADGSTSFIDESSSPLTVAFDGTARISTAQSKFGGGSLIIDASGDCLKITPAVAAFGFGENSWTAEAHVRLSVAPALGVLFDFRNAPGFNNLAVFIDSNRRIGILTASTVYGTTGNQLVVNQWHHVAACFDATNRTYRLFLDGVNTWTGVFPVWSPLLDFGATRQIYIGRQIPGDTTLSTLLGNFNNIRVTAGAWYTAAFTPPTEPYETGTPKASLSDTTVLRSPAIAGAVGYFGQLRSELIFRPAAISANVPQLAWLLDASILRSPSVLAAHDFTDSLSPSVSTAYVMDLVTPGGLVRVPISSWQATLQTDVQSYVQCVVPAATDWVPDIEASTEFVIMRRGMLLDGRSIEYEMARAPAQIVALNGGVYNYTATISGYTAAFEAVENPATSLDRTLTGVRTVSRYTGTTRVRCEIDWLLRPGQRAYLGAEPIVVSFINYYVPGFDQYMDIGDRS